MCDKTVIISIIYVLRLYSVGTGGARFYFGCFPRQPTVQFQNTNQCSKRKNETHRLIPSLSKKVTQLTWQKKGTTLEMSVYNENKRVPYNRKKETHRLDPSTHDVTEST
jgi:hypothetical protein